MPAPENTEFKFVLLLMMRRVQHTPLPTGPTRLLSKMSHSYLVRILRKQFWYQTLGVQMRKRKRPNQKLVPTFRCKTILETLEPILQGVDFH
jgi:hypothetical protein